MAGMKASALFGAAGLPIGGVTDVYSDGRDSIHAGQYLRANGQTLNVDDYPELASFSTTQVDALAAGDRDGDGWGVMLSDGTNVRSYCLNDYDNGLAPWTQSALTSATLYGGNLGSYTNLWGGSTDVIRRCKPGGSWSSPISATWPGLDGLMQNFYINNTSGQCCWWSGWESYQTNPGSAAAMVLGVRGHAYFDTNTPSGADGETITAVARVGDALWCFIRDEDGPSVRVAPLLSCFVTNTDDVHEGAATDIGIGSQLFPDASSARYDTVVGASSWADYLLLFTGNGHIRRSPAGWLASPVYGEANTGNWDPVLTAWGAPDAQQASLVTNKAGECLLLRWNEGYKSTDKGATWTALTTFSGLPVGKLRNVYYDERTDLWVGVDDHAYPCTSPDGFNWTSYDVGLQGPPAGNVFTAFIRAGKLETAPGRSNTTADTAKHVSIDGTFSLPTMPVNRAGTFPYIRGK